MAGWTRARHRRPALYARRRRRSASIPAAWRRWAGSRSVTTLSSGSTITPVVGLLPGRPPLVANPHEVEHVFDVSLAELVDPAVFREEWWAIPGRGPAGATGSGANDGSEPFPVWFFELPDDTVWGATARMLVDLLRLVLEV